MIQQEKSHQHHQAACHCHRQISLRRPQGLLLLIMGYPYIRGKGHQLKKDKRSIQIRRQENPHGGTQSNQQKQIVPVSIPIMPKILPGKHRRNHPHKCRNQPIQSPESIQSKMQPHPANSKNITIRRITKRIRRILAKLPGYIRHPKHIKRRQKFKNHYNISYIISRRFVSASNQISKSGSCHGKKYKPDQHPISVHNYHPFPIFIAPYSIRRPHPRRTSLTAKKTIQKRQSPPQTLLTAPAFSSQGRKTPSPYLHQNPPAERTPLLQ